MNPNPTLVFIHGTAGHSSEFAAQEEHFSNNFKCLSIDLKGETLSAWVKETEDKLLANACSEQSYFLIGHSLGGLVALCLASTPSAYKVRGIALLDTLMLVPEDARPGLLSLRTALHSPAYTEVLSHFVNTYFVSTEDEVEIRTALVARILEFPKDKFLPLWAASEEFDTEPVIKKLKIPLLYLHSGVPTDLSKLETLLPDLVKIVKMKKPGHYPHIFSANETNAYLSDFIQAHSSTTHKLPT